MPRPFRAAAGRQRLWPPFYLLLMTTETLVIQSAADSQAANIGRSIRVAHWSVSSIDSSCSIAIRLFSTSHCTCGCRCNSEPIASVPDRKLTLSFIYFQHCYECPSRRAFDLPETHVCLYVYYADIDILLLACGEINNLLLGFSLMVYPRRGHRGSNFRHQRRTTQSVIQSKARDGWSPAV